MTLIRPKRSQLVSTSAAGIQAWLPLVVQLALLGGGRELESGPVGSRPQAGLGWMLLGLCSIRNKSQHRVQLKAPVSIAERELRTKIPLLSRTWTLKGILKLPFLGGLFRLSMAGFRVESALMP